MLHYQKAPVSVPGSRQRSLLSGTGPRQCHRAHRLPPPARSYGKKFSQEAVTCIQKAREIAASYCTMFVDPDHLFLGVLSTPSETVKLLNHMSMTRDAANEIMASVAVSAIDKDALSLADIDLTPASKVVLAEAQDLAGSGPGSCTTTAHIMMSLLGKSNICKSIITEHKVEEDALKNGLMALAEKLDEDAVSPPTAEQQIETLKAEYERLSSGKASGLRAPEDIQYTAEDDDIYN